MKYLLLITLLFTFGFSAELSREDIVMNIDKSVKIQFEAAYPEGVQNILYSSDKKYLMKRIAWLAADKSKVETIEKYAGKSLKMSMSNKYSGVEITSQSFSTNYNVLVVYLLKHNELESLTSLVYILSSLDSGDNKYENFIKVIEGGQVDNGDFILSLLSSKKINDKKIQRFIFDMSMGDFQSIRKTLRKQNLDLIYLQALKESLN